MNIWYWWRNYKLRIKHAKELAWVNRIEKEYFKQCYDTYPELKEIKRKILRNCMVYKETYDPGCIKALDQIILVELIPYTLKKITEDLHKINESRK